MKSRVRKIQDPNIAAAPALALAICPDGQSVLTSGLDFHLRKWDLQTETCTHSWDARGPLYAIQTIASENTALLAAVQGIVRWDLETWDLHPDNTLWSYKAINALGYAQLTGEVLGGCEDSTIHRWRLESAEKLDSLRSHRSSVSALGVDRQGRMALSGDITGELRLWNLENGFCLRAWQGHSETVKAIAIANDVSTAISCSQTGQICAWDLSTGDCLLTLKHSQRWLHALALFKDGHKAVAGGEGGIYLWDLISSRLVAHYEQAGVVDLDLIANERSVAAIIKSNELIVWTIP